MQVSLKTEMPNPFQSIQNAGALQASPCRTVSPCAAVVFYIPLLPHPCGIINKSGDLLMISILKEVWRSSISPLSFSFYCFAWVCRERAHQQTVLLSSDVKSWGARAAFYWSWTWRINTAACVDASSHGTSADGGDSGRGAVIRAHAASRRVFKVQSWLKVFPQWWVILFALINKWLLSSARLCVRYLRFSHSLSLSEEGAHTSSSPSHSLLLFFL